MAGLATVWVSLTSRSWAAQTTRKVNLSYIHTDRARGEVLKHQRPSPNRREDGRQERQARGRSEPLTVTYRWKGQTPLVTPSDRAGLP